MKFEKNLLVLIIAVMSITAVGCGNNSDTPQTKKPAQETGASGSESQKVTLPEGSPALVGKVKEIIGNEVTLFKAEVSQNERPPEEAPANRPQNQSNQANQTNQSNQTNQANQGERPENRGFRMNFTKETETIMIPVGTPIVTMQRGANGTNKASQVGLTEIKKDTVLRIWQRDDTINFVQIAGGSGTRNAQSGAGSGNRSGNPSGMGGPPTGIGSPLPGMGGNR